MTVKISPSRQALLDDLGNVTRWMDGEDYHHQYAGRRWKVTRHVRWLLDNGLIEPDPADDDMDIKGYRRVVDRAPNGEPR